jgi:hypothetical protein
MKGERRFLLLQARLYTMKGERRFPLLQARLYTMKRERRFLLLQVRLYTMKEERRFHLLEVRLYTMKEERSVLLSWYITWLVTRETSVLLSWYITWPVTRETWLMPSVEQELITLPEHSSSTTYNVVRVAQYLVFCVVICRLLFVFFAPFFWPLLCISILLRITASDYSFCIFRVFVWL